MALLLAGHHDNARKRRSSLKSRLYTPLPAPEWLTDRLRSCGVQKPNPWEKPVAPTQAEIVGLAMVKPQMVFEGNLTPWTLEGNLLWRYWGRPEASYTVQIDRFFELEEPFTVFVRTTGGRGNGCGKDIDLAHWIFFPSVGLEMDSDTKLASEPTFFL